MNPFIYAKDTETYEARYTADATTRLRALGSDFPSVPRHIEIGCGNGHSVRLVEA